MTLKSDYHIIVLIVCTYENFIYFFEIFLMSELEGEGEGEWKRLNKIGDQSLRTVLDVDGDTITCVICHGELRVHMI